VDPAPLWYGAHTLDLSFDLKPMWRTKSRIGTNSRIYAWSVLRQRLPDAIAQYTRRGQLVMEREYDRRKGHTQRMAIGFDFKNSSDPVRYYHDVGLCNSSSREDKLRKELARVLEDGCVGLERLERLICDVDYGALFMHVGPDA
jgi:hypothetical protein